MIAFFFVLHITFEMLSNLVYSVVDRGRNKKQPVRCQWHLKVEEPGIKFMTTFKVMVVKTKFIVTKYN